MFTDEEVKTESLEHVYRGPWLRLNHIISLSLKPFVSRSKIGQSVFQWCVTDRMIFVSHL